MYTQRSTNAIIDLVFYNIVYQSSDFAAPPQNKSDC